MEHRHQHQHRQSIHPLEDLRPKIRDAVVDQKSHEESRTQNHRDLRLVA